jgi:hypothetical protein
MSVTRRVLGVKFGDSHAPAAGYHEDTKFTKINEGRFDSVEEGTLTCGV